MTKKQSALAGAWFPAVAANIGALSGEQIDVVEHGGGRNRARPVKIGQRMSAWRVSDIKAFLESWER